MDLIYLPESSSVAHIMPSQTQAVQVIKPQKMFPDSINTLLMVGCCLTEIVDEAMKFTQLNVPWMGQAGVFLMKASGYRYLEGLIFCGILLF